MNRHLSCLAGLVAGAALILPTTATAESTCGDRGDIRSATSMEVTCSTVFAVATKARVSSCQSFSTRTVRTCTVKPVSGGRWSCTARYRSYDGEQLRSYKCSSRYSGKQLFFDIAR